MSKTFKFKLTLTSSFIIAGIVILTASTILWFNSVYSSPTNVFNRMLETSLSTPSVAKLASQDGESQSLEQTSVLVVQPEPKVHSVSVLGQGESSDTKIVTESIATQEYDYVRYVDINTSQQNSAGEDFDFSSVLGIWGKSDKASPNGGGAQLFNQTILGVVPFANLPKHQRNELVKQIKDDGVYEFDSANTKRQTVNGRPVYSYDVTVKPVSYVTMLKKFSKSMGLKQLDTVDPAQYANSAPLKFTMEIDAWTGQLSKITYDQSVRVEEFSAYGAKSQIELPTSSISVNELQDRLRQIQ